MNDMTLKEAREKYKNNEIPFMELDSIFWKKATKKEKDLFCSSPVYDRGNVVIGMTQQEMDADWNNLIN